MPITLKYGPDPGDVGRAAYAGGVNRSRQTAAAIYAPLIRQREQAEAIAERAQQAQQAREDFALKMAQQEHHWAAEQKYQEDTAAIGGLMGQMTAGQFTTTEEEDKLLKKLDAEESLLLDPKYNRRYSQQELDAAHGQLRARRMAILRGAQQRGIPRQSPEERFQQGTFTNEQGTWGWIPGKYGPTLKLLAPAEEPEKEETPQQRLTAGRSFRKEVEERLQQRVDAEMAKWSAQFPKFSDDEAKHAESRRVYEEHFRPQVEREVWQMMHPGKTVPGEESQGGEAGPAATAATQPIKRVPWQDQWGRTVQIPMLSDPSQVKTLPPGQIFMDPEGNIRRVPQQ